MLINQGREIAMNVSTIKQDRRETRTAEWKRFIHSAVSVSDNTHNFGGSREQLPVEGAMELRKGETEELSDSRVEGLVLWREKTDDGCLSVVR
jgi:hypothetical protein